MFDFEWINRREASDEDEMRGTDAAEAFCEKHGIDAAKEWRLVMSEISDETWDRIERAALDAMCKGWTRETENASLIWK